MSYVELIVVLSIFSVLSSMAIYNYGAFQANVDMKNLASDIALKIVEAQKSSLNGVLPLAGAPFLEWKPSYGVYFNITTPEQFIYFADLDQDGVLYNPDCSTTNSECLDKITITKGNKILRIEKCTDSACPPFDSDSISSFSVSFKRPNSSAIFSGASLTGSEYIKITIKSPKDNTSFIKVYPSGRIQIN